MKKLWLYALCSVALVGLGIGCGYLLFGLTDQAAQGGDAVPASVNVRVNDGEIEWSFGRGWNSAGTLAELAGEDPYAPGLEWDAFPQPSAEAAAIFSASKVPVAVQRPAASSGGGGGGGGGGVSVPSGGGGGATSGDGEDIGWSSDVLD